MSIKETERALEGKLYRLRKKKQWLNHMKRRLIGAREVLTKQQKEAVITYYKPYIALKETMGHEWYTEKTGNFFVNYIPDWVWHGYIDPFYNDVEAAAKLENKCFFENMFPNCPHPVNLGYRANGIWYTNAHGVLTYDELMKAISNEAVLFIKQANVSCGGFGVVKVEGSDIVKKVTEIVSKISKDIVIQRPIQQSDVLNSINPSSVNSIRVLSLLRPENVKIYSMVLRVGVGDSYVDNACSGGLMVGINLDGSLKEKAFYRNGDSCTVHPTTGTEFGKVVLPNIHAVADMVKKIHPQIPYFRLVSWDIVLDEQNQPLLLEANLREGGIDIHQLTNGPVFGEDTTVILEEVFGKRRYKR